MPSPAVLLPSAVLSLFRIVIGFLFACHGAATLFNVLGGPHGGQVPPTGQWPGWYAAVIQLVGGGLVVVGLGTRIAAFVCSGSMAYAYFVVHGKLGLFPLVNGGEAAALFCWSFFLLVALGPGVLSMDAVVKRAFRPAVPSPAPAPAPAEVQAPEPTRVG